MCVCVVPAAPFKPEGERVGSNGILLSWKMPSPPDLTIDSFIIRYKEVCPHPDPTFTEVRKNMDIPETLLNTLSPGATYNIKVFISNYIFLQLSHLACSLVIFFYLLYIQVYAKLLYDNIYC